MRRGRSWFVQRFCVKSETEFSAYVINWRDPRPWSEILGPGAAFSTFAPLPAGWSDFPVHIGNLYDSLMSTNYVATFNLVMYEAVGSTRSAKICTSARIGVVRQYRPARGRWRISM
jgi:hypothetical protein